MKFELRRAARAALCTAACVLVVPAAAAADHKQPAPDIQKMDYTPVGGIKPGDVIPLPLSPPTENNPSGKWVVYDTNVFESLNFPGRQPGDETSDDAPGSGMPLFGFCPPSAEGYPIWGKCANHQLEYLDYYEREMKKMLGDFGVVTKRYGFHSPGSGCVGFCEPGSGFPLDGAAGKAYNVAAVVPGADHPEETVIVSGHYDFTDSGPAAAWDSSEGHAMVMRIAKIMSDYWRATGTRPSATVKFMPFDSEESGTYGSVDYVENNIPPGEEGKVRGYFNMDPCAGAYPAKRQGVLPYITEVLQLSDPASAGSEEQQRRVADFNKRALTIVDEVFDKLDDTVDGAKVFISDKEAQAGEGPSQRGNIVTALGGLALFSSDYANFAQIGVPIFNLFPDMFGPHADGSFASPDALAILHTPRDNLQTLNAQTSVDQSGLTASEGWMKGQEMCAQIEAWYMMQPEMVGNQRASKAPVAYFEALPNEAGVGEKIKFDAGGSFAWTNPKARALAADKRLRFSWEFGDGSKAKGKVVEHAYARTGVFRAKLTVSAGRLRDSMTVPMTIVAKAPDRGEAVMRARRVVGARMRRGTRPLHPGVLSDVLTKRQERLVRRGVVRVLR